VTYRDRLDPERPDLDRVTHPHLAQVGLTQDAVLPQLRLEEAKSQPSAVNRHVELLERVGQASDVVLMTVGEKNAEHLSATVQQVRDVRQDQVDPEHVLLREHQPGVDDENLVLPLERPHVDADLAQAAEGEIPKPRRAHKRRSCSDSCFGPGTGTGGGGGASSWSRYRLSWSKSCSRSATSEPLCSAAAGW